MSYNFEPVKLENIKEKPSWILALTLYLVPLWWFIGLSPVIYHLAALVYFYLVLKRERKIVLPAPAIYLLLFLSIYLFSFSINWFKYPIVRGAASLYNMSIWFMGIMLIAAIYSDENFETDLLFKASAFLVWFTLVFLFLDYFIYLRHGNFSFPTLIGIFLHPPHTESSLVRLFFRAKTHIVGRGPLVFLPRISYYSPYPNAFAGLILLLWGAGFSFYLRKGRKTLAHIFNLASIFLLFLSMSRASFFLGVAILSYFELSLLPLTGALVFLSVGALGIGVLFALGINPMEIFEKVAYGSTQVRIQEYRDALRVVELHPVWGIGLKPRYLQGIPLGSHSTYIGILQKTGLMGFFTLLAFEISLIREFLRKLKLPYIAAGIFSIFVWMFFEDIDAPALTAFLFFTLSGLLIKYNLKGGEDART